MVVKWSFLKCGSIFNASDFTTSGNHIKAYMALEIFLDRYLTSSTFAGVTKLTQSFLLTIDWHHFESHDDSISLWNRFQVSLLTFSYPRGAIDLLNDTALQYQAKHNDAFS